MKKSVKNTVALTSSAIIGFSIASISALVVSNNKNLLNDSQLRASTNNFQLSANSGVYISNKNNSFNYINSVNPNTIKSTPYGVISTYGQNCDKVIAFDKNNPNKILWTIDRTGFQILTVEYNSLNDSVIILAQKDDKPYIGLYKNTANTNNGSTLSQAWWGKVSDETSQTWAMIPVINQNDVNSTEYFVYSKQVPQSGGSYTSENFYRFDITNNKITTQNMALTSNHSSGRPSDLLGVAMIKKGTEYFAFVIRTEQDWYTNFEFWMGTWANFAWLQFQIYRADGDGSFANRANNNTSWRFYASYKDAPETRVKYLNSYPNSFAIKKDSGNNISVSFYSKGIRDNDKGEISPAFLTSTFHLDTGGFSVSTSVAKFDETLNHMQFDLSYNVRHGISTTTNPLIFMGTNSNIASQVNKYIGILRDFGSFPSITSTSTGSDNLKIYGINGDTVPDWPYSSNRWIYSGLPIIAQENKLDEQEVFGIPVLSYNDSNIAINNRKVFYTRAGSEQVAIINDTNPSQNYKSSVKYDYFTQPTNTTVKTIVASDANKPIIDVDLNYVIQEFNIEAETWTQSNFLTQAVGIINSPESARFTISNLRKDLKQGSITFDLYSTQLYDSNGYVQWTNSLSDLKSSLWSAHKIASITVTGYRIVKPTEMISSSQAIGNPDVVPTNWYTGNADNEKLQNLIFNNKDNIFSCYPPTFTSSNIVIKSVTTNNLLGTLDVKFTLNNYYNSSSQLVTNSESSQFSLEITGFKTQQPTSQISTTIKTNNTQLSPNAYMNQDAATDNLKAFIASNINTLFNNIPLDFGQSNIDIVSTSQDNRNGNLGVTFRINNYYNNKGILVNGSWTNNFSITITGFKIQLGTTFPNNNGSFNLGDKNKTPTDYFGSNLVLQNLVANNKDTLFQHLPADFTASNVNIVGSPETNNINGTIKFTFNINNWFNSDGYLQKTNSENRTITVTGFKIQNPTSYKGGETLSIGDSSQVPSNFVAANGNLENLLFKNINSLFDNLPSGLNATNIIVRSSSTNNISGEVSVIFTINNYFNSAGVQTNDDAFPNINATITGFKTQPATVFPDNFKEFNFGDATKVPTDFYNDNDTNVQNLINKNKANIFTNLPNNFAQSNILISSVNTDNIEGTITVTFAINNWFNSQGVLSNVNSAEVTIIIKGFKSQQPTTQKELVINSNQSSIRPFDYYNNGDGNQKLRNLIASNQAQIFNNLPNSFNAQNVSIKNEPTINNLDGTISLTFTINRFYNEQGILVTNGESSDYNITFSGFKSQQPTNIISPAEIGIKSQRASDYYFVQNFQSNLKNLIIENKTSVFENLPDAFGVNNLTLNIEDIKINNAEGSLSFIVIVDSYYDEQGLLVSANQKQFNLTINGFKQDTSSTQFNSDLVSLAGIDEYLPSKWELWKNDVLQAIINSGSLINLFNSNITTEDIELTNIVTEDLTGILQADVIIKDNFAQQNGLCVESLTIPSVVFNGFKVYSGRTSTFVNNPNVDKTPFADIVPTDMTFELLNSEEFKNQIIKYIEQPEIGEIIVPDDIEIKVVSNSADNLAGTLGLSIVINNNKFLDEGVPVASRAVTTTVKGFKTQKPTSLIEKTYNVNDESQKPSDYNINNISHNSRIKQFLFNNREKIFSNLPTDFSIDNIKIISVSPDNKIGTLAISLEVNNYYDDRGVLQNNKDKQFDITLTGLKVVTEKSNLGKIIGGVIAIAGGVILIGVVVWLVMRNKES